MKTAGSIDRPRSHGPAPRPHQCEDLTMTSSHQVAVTTDRTGTGAPAVRQNRTREMQLIPEALARARLNPMLRRAESERRGARLIAARRMQRRAERASLRARRALAMAVMQ